MATALLYTLSLSVLGLLGQRQLGRVGTRQLIVFEEPFTTTGLCHLPCGRFNYKFGATADAFVAAILERKGRFGQLTTDPFGSALPVGLLARISSHEPCSDGTGGRLVTADFGLRFVPLETVQSAPHKVMRIRPYRDPWRLWPQPGSGRLRKDVLQLSLRVAELQHRLADAAGEPVPLSHGRLLELGPRMQRPNNAELLSFAALSVAGVPFMMCKALLVSTDTRERLMFAHEALEPLAKELEAKAALQAAAVRPTI